MKYDPGAKDCWQFNKEELATIIGALDEARAEPYFGPGAFEPPNRFEELYQNILLFIATLRAKGILK